MSDSHPVSGYIMTYQDPKRLEVVIRHMLPFIDDLFVLDGGDPDGEAWTMLQRLESEIAMLSIHSWPQEVAYYGSNEAGAGWREPDRRNACVDRCAHDWIWTIDTDELMSDMPISYFRDTMTPLRFPRFNVYTPDQYIHVRGTDTWYPDYQIRFFNKNGVRYTNTPLHCAPAHKVGNGRLITSDCESSPHHIWHYRRARMELNNRSDEDGLYETKYITVPLPASHFKMMMEPHQ